jgi:hypothetical protein
MDFEAEEVQQSIPSRSSYAPSDKQKSYTAGDTIRFHIPQFDAFLDPRMTSLNFKLKVSDAGAVCRFSNRSGVHSLIENVRVYDANTNLQLETIQNYNAIADKLHLYSENKSIRNKRGLVEGLEYTSRDFDGEYYDNLPARMADTSQLFNHQYKTGNNASYTANVSPTSDPNTIEVALHLYSGILGAMSNKMFPIILTNGLRIEIDTANPEQALEIWTGEGIVNDDGSVSDVVKGSSRFIIQNANPQTANPLTSVDLMTERNAGYNQVPNPQPPTQDCLDNGAGLVKNQLVGGINLVVGQDLYGWNNASPPVWKRLGEIVSVDCNSGDNTGGDLRVRVSLDGSGANGDEYIGGGGNDNGGNPQDPLNNTCGMRQEDLFSGTPKITISDVQFIIKTIQPPQSYISSMLKQVSTSEGVKYDYLTLDTYRNNVLAGERVIQINIPTLNHRATSIMTLPLDNSQAIALQHQNLDTIVDDAQNYNYLIDNKLQPTRKVRLTQLNQTPARTEQVALFECEKSLSSVKIHPKNLDYQAENFFVGRALAKYGGVYNLAETGNASLRVEYQNPTKNKLLITYIGGVRRLVINKDGRYIET